MRQQPAISVCLASNMSAVCDTSPTAPMIVLDVQTIFTRLVTLEQNLASNLIMDETLDTNEVGRFV